MNAISKLMRPASVAVIGASADVTKTSGRPVAYLRKHGFDGDIYPVNPRYDSIDGLPCYADVASLPHAPDVGIVLLGAERAHVAVRDLASRGTSAAIVLASGYAEIGEEGAKRSSGLVVLYDELALPLGTLRVRAGGSSGGHNGARSINGSLGTEEWARIRIGVGPDGLETASRRGKDYLLTPMRKKELAVLDEVLDRVAEAVETVIVSGVGAAMNKWNGPAGNGSSKTE